jgi:RNA polymerase sigma-70 factor (ECF subfamily)
MTDAPENKAALTTMHVRRAIDGDRTSLGWLVARLRPLLVAQARYRLGPELQALHDPDDLVHDAWLVAIPKLEELRAREGHFTPVLLRFLSTTLLYRIQNLVRQHVRRARARGGAAERLPLEDVPADASGVVSRALRAERRDLVTEAIDQLPDTDRQVLVLRGVEQLSNRAAAAILGVTADAVGMRYLRALRRLRERLPDSVLDELDEV